MPVALLVWQAIELWLNKPMLYSSSARDHFIEFVESKSDNVKRKVTGLIWQARIWKIKKIRNGLIFKDSVIHRWNKSVFMEEDTCSLSIIVYGSILFVGQSTFKVHLC